MKNDTPKVTTPITATDILAVAAKSEVVPTTFTRHGSIDNTKIEKNSCVKQTFFLF
jgi:hypothetical protein